MVRLGSHSQTSAWMRTVVRRYMRSSGPGGESSCGHIITTALPINADPGNGVAMKIWECYDNLPAQQWIYNNSTDRTIRLANTSEPVSMSTCPKLTVTLQIYVSIYLMVIWQMVIVFRPGNVTLETIIRSGSRRRTGRSKWYLRSLINSIYYLAYQLHAPELEGGRLHRD